MTFKGFIKTNYWRFIYINFLALVSGLGAVFAGYVQMYWLTAVKNHNWAQVLLTALLMGICYLGAQGMIYYVQYVVRIQEEEYDQQIRHQIFAHYFKDGHFHPVASVQNRISNDINLVRDNYFDWYPIVPFYGTMLIGALVALLTIHWSIFVLSLIVDAVAYFVPKLAQKKMEKATNNVSRQNKWYLQTLAQWFRGLEELRRYFAGAKLFSVQKKAARRIEQAHVQQTAAQQEMIILNGICNVFSQLILLTMTAWLITKNLIIFGAIMSVTNFAANISIGLQQTLQAISFMKSAQDLMQKIGQDAAPVKVKEQGPTELPAEIATLNLAVNFKNGESLKFPDLVIRQGEKILLTGDSGAGKSTLFKLILGSLKPTSGQIIYKNQAGQPIKPDLSRIGYIPQEPNLFPGTIKENITMFNSRLNKGVAKAVGEVGLSDDLAKFKDGADEKLNLDQLNVSGGQRQKIVLARAKIHGSELILIDEGTSAIDQAGTLAILQNLLHSKATVVFIAHSFNEQMRSLFDREIHLVKE